MPASNESEIKTGWGLYRQSDWAGAERCCLKVLGLSPAHGGALGLLGILRLTAGRADEAAAMLSQALNTKPRDAMLLGGLGLARLMQGNAVAAEEALRGALKWGGGDAMLHMRLGMALGAQGRTIEAIAELRRSLALAPENVDVMLNLANALADAGQTEDAGKLLRAILARQPGHADARFNLGTLLTRLNRLEQAAAEFQTLLTHYPGHAEVHNSLGVVWERQALLDQAESAYRKTLSLDDKHVAAWNNLGNVLRVRNRMDEAEACYGRAVQIAPGHADGYLNQGLLRVSRQQWEEAIALFRKALALDPHCIEAAINLGEALRQRGALADAITAFRQALAIDAHNARALNGLGDALRMQGALDAAADCYLQATRAAPREPDGFLNLGVLRAQQGRYAEAVAALRQAAGTGPENVHVHIKLAEALRTSGQLEAAKAAYLHALALQPGNPAASAGLAHVRQHLCDWEGIEVLWEVARKAIRDGVDAGITPFSALSIPTTSEEQLACARAWARSEFGWITDRIAVARPAAARLKLGYLSWDYHEHATAYLIAEIFELHDRERFSVTAYSFGPDDGSAIRQRIRGACDGFVDIAALSDADAARRIAADGIDILIDLKGYTLGARTPILAYRPAPVQVNWLGFPGTMGTPCIDWILADPFIIPQGADAAYDERVCRLPDCYQPNDRQRRVAEAPTRTECGLPESGVVFCCFNQAYKILPETYAAWMRILCRVPGSVLWLLETHADAMHNLRRHAETHGVSAERIHFASRQPLAHHLARYRVADLALDTFPYTSHTTASDALWAGCPLVTRVGDTFAARVAGSVLSAAGLPELITHDIAEFEELAVTLALDTERRAKLRRYLEQERMCLPLFDAPRFVRNLEHAFESMR
jgi:protein O-GlcNAc transferase